MKKLVLLLCLLLAVPVSAQDRPISGTTVQTTDTTANSLLVGCAIGSTTCAGGIKAGPLAVGAISGTSGTFTAALSATTLTGSVTDAGVGTKTLIATFARTGASTSASERMGGFAFSDANNPTLTAGITGIRENSSGNFLGGLGFFVQSAGSAATDFSGLTETARFTSAGLLQLKANLATVSLDGTGTNGLGLSASNGSGAIRFYTGGANLRWGINSAGDFTVGASSHIALSNGTPTVASGFWTTTNTVNGSDYAFSVTGTGSNTASGVINFGHTWSSTPVCVATNSTGTAAVIITAISTTSVSMSVGAGTLATPFNVICHGY